MPSPSPAAVAKKSQSDRDWMLLSEAAALLGVSVNTVRLLIQQGKLTSRRVNSWHKLDRREVEAFDKQATRPATAPT